MVPSRYQLGEVGRFLLEQLELRRPGIQEWTPAVEASLRQSLEGELQQMEKQCRELGVDDPQYWQRVRRAIDDILLPRYAVVAKAEIALARREYGVWRGGDLVARGVFAAAGFILGIIAVEVPYIPIQAKWFPAALMLTGPFFPDVVVGWYRWRFRRKLSELVNDLTKASQTLETYRPLSELTQAAEMPSELPSDLAEAPPRRERV
jgi:hypothetical protein